MHGQHARPTSTLFDHAPAAGTPPGPGAKHSRRRGRLTLRLRRRLLAYRAIDFQPVHLSGDPERGEECLLLVHIRKVVGQVQYRICTECTQGVITAVVIDEPFHSTGLSTRALSHLRSRHPELAWFSTMRRRTTRDLLRRMRIPTVLSPTPCSHPHGHQTPSRAAGPALTHR
ncbi:hypothetical protein ACFYVL_00880 [Streptomyces sp. NPDC004111]|uniref:hypothetical protein n=1 Tax=Streptomyces sp. NPDC004111 TaxID=3364690 RepID=UPI0036B6E036